jgi:hypothetical protein
LVLARDTFVSLLRKNGTSKASVASMVSVWPMADIVGSRDVPFHFFLKFSMLKFQKFQKFS